MPSDDASLQGEERSALQTQIPQQRGERIWDLIRSLAYEVRNLAHAVRDLAHEVRNLAHEARNLAHEAQSLIRNLTHEVQNQIRSLHEPRDLADLAHRVRLLENRQDERDCQPASWSNDGISFADCRDKGYRDEENLEF